MASKSTKILLTLILANSLHQVLRNQTRSRMSNEDCCNCQYGLHVEYSTLIGEIQGKNKVLMVRNVFGMKSDKENTLRRGLAT